MPIKNNLLTLRVKKLYTLKQFARKCGVSETTISFIENNLAESVMTITKVKIATALNVSVEEVFPRDREIIDEAIDSLIENQKEEKE